MALIELAEILDKHKEWVESGGESGIKEDLSGANLVGADLTGVNLQGAILTKANLAGADLSMANLRGAHLVHADLRNTTLLGTELRGANLMGATLYGSEGLWAGLFRKSADYERTELVRDVAIKGRFLTLDYWQTEEAFHEFKQRNLAEYERLDKEFEGLTEQETRLGAFWTES